MPASKPVLIDTDPGLDDLLALVLALRSPVLDVRAITVVAGNVSVDACTANALRILEAAGVEPPPVFRGCAEPISPPVTRAEHVHGADGIGGVSEAWPVQHLQTENAHAVEAILDLARRHPGELTLITLGPLTNVAMALERDPAALANIREIVVMGGSGDGRGNVTSTRRIQLLRRSVCGPCRDPIRPARYGGRAERDGTDTPFPRSLS